MPQMTAMVAALLLERPLCLDCLAEKAGASRAAIATTLVGIENVLRVNRSAQQRCHSCSNLGAVVFIDRPGG